MRRSFAAIIAVYAVLAADHARADDRAVVQAFYEQILSAPAAPDLAERVQRFLAPTWRSLGANSGSGNDPPGFVRAVQGFGQVVPNLRWEVVEVISDGNRHVVRGRATGTPVRPFLGVEPTGRSFDIMSIDIHTVEGGRIVRSYHIEDWAGAMRQLRNP
jgi:predicted ester cyclase